MTAWNAVFEFGDLKPGATVLVQGSGGVSIFALQFALAAGARVFAITGSQAKVDRLERLGAEHVIRYEREPEWITKTLRIQGVIVGSVEHLNIRPVIDETFEMQDVAAALEYLKSGHHLGKIIIKVEMDRLPFAAARAQSAWRD